MSDFGDYAKNSSETHTDGAPDLNSDDGIIEALQNMGKLTDDGETKEDAVSMKTILETAANLQIPGLEEESIISEEISPKTIEDTNPSSSKFSKTSHIVSPTSGISRSERTAKLRPSGKTPVSDKSQDLGFSSLSSKITAAKVQKGAPDLDAISDSQLSDISGRLERQEKEINNLTKRLEVIPELQSTISGLRSELTGVTTGLLDLKRILKAGIAQQGDTPHGAPDQPDNQSTMESVVTLEARKRAIERIDRSREVASTSNSTGGSEVTKVAFTPKPTNRRRI